MVLVMLLIAVMAMYIILAVHSNCFGSFSAWITNVTVITAAAIGMLMFVGMYVHFPTHLCEQCGRASYLSTGQNEQNQSVQPPDHNNPTQSIVSNPHSTVTTETTPLIPHAPKVGHHNDRSHTSYSVAHSPVTTETAALISHPPKVDHHNDLVTHS